MDIGVPLREIEIEPLTDPLLNPLSTDRQRIRAPTREAEAKPPIRQGVRRAKIPISQDDPSQHPLEEATR